MYISLKQYNKAKCSYITVIKYHSLETVELDVALCQRLCHVGAIFQH